MTTYPRTHFLFEIADLDAPIPAGKLEYLQERLRNNLYNFIVSKFLERHENYGLTQAALARRIGCDPGRLSKLLGAPGNWTIGTISDLLVGISAEEFVPDSESLVDRKPRNYTGQLSIIEDDIEWANNASATESNANKPLPTPPLGGSARKKRPLSQERQSDPAEILRYLP